MTASSQVTIRQKAHTRHAWSVVCPHRSQEPSVRNAESRRITRMPEGAPASDVVACTTSVGTRYHKGVRCQRLCRMHAICAKPLGLSNLRLLKRFRQAQHPITSACSPFKSMASLLRSLRLSIKCAATKPKHSHRTPRRGLNGEAAAQRGVGRQLLERFSSRQEAAASLRRR